MIKKFKATSLKSKIERYKNETFDRAEQYKLDIESGDQISCNWIKLAVKRSRADAKRKDIEFRVDAVKRVFEFFYYINIKLGFKYKRFILSPFQAWMVSEIFGWYYTETGTRRYRYAVLYTARKSGKTVFSVACELYMLMYDHEEDPEAYLCAMTREQAGQALRYSKNIIKRSPSLKSRLKVQQFKIIYNKHSGLLKVLANKPDANDSLNPYVFILDEMHAHKTLDFFNVMKSGIMSRVNPLGLITSTAGFNKDYPFYKMVETGKKTLEGVIEDDITFYALYTLDDDDDIEDYHFWVKANPNIGQTIRLDALKKEYSKAKLTVSELNNFITKNLNRYIDNIEQWIPDTAYVRCFNTVAPKMDHGKKIKAFAGIDLSANRDLAALVLVWTDPDTDKMVVTPEFYFPSNEIKRVRDNGIDLGEWIKKGYIIQQDSQTIDYEKIFERIAYWNTIFDISLFFYDEWNSGYLVTKLKSELYIDCRPFRQNATYFNFPLKYLEKLIFDENISLSDNPVMRWMFRNISLYYDGNGNIKIMKNKSLDSVDGPVALGMAVGAWLSYNGDATAAFFHELMDRKPNDILKKDNN